jgi:hypothetical protein
MEKIKENFEKNEIEYIETIKTIKAMIEEFSNKEKEEQNKEEGTILKHIYLAEQKIEDLENEIKKMEEGEVKDKYNQTLKIYYRDIFQEHNKLRESKKKNKIIFKNETQTEEEVEKEELNDEESFNMSEKKTEDETFLIAEENDKILELIHDGSQNKILGWFKKNFKTVLILLALLCLFIILLIILYFILTPIFDRIIFI